MFIQINDNKSLPVDDIIMILNKDCFNKSRDLSVLEGVEIIECICDSEEDIKSYIITKDEDNIKDKRIGYKLYKSTKSSLSLLNKYDKLEGTND